MHSEHFWDTSGQVLVCVIQEQNGEKNMVFLLPNALSPVTACTLAKVFKSNIILRKNCFITEQHKIFNIKEIYVLLSDGK